jgi:HSP20 family protein
LEPGRSAITDLIHLPFEAHHLAPVRQFHLLLIEAAHGAHHESDLRVDGRAKHGQRLLAAALAVCSGVLKLEKPLPSQRHGRRATSNSEARNATLILGVPMFIVPFNRPSSLASQLFDLRAEHRSPAVDIAESDATYTVTLDVPGVAKDDIKVTVDGRRVDIEARAEKTEEKKDDSQRIVYRERSASRYARSFTLPVELDEGQSAAKLENGVLSLTLAKRRAAVSRLQIN